MLEVVWLVQAHKLTSTSICLCKVKLFVTKLWFCYTNCSLGESGGKEREKVAGRLLEESEAIPTVQSNNNVILEAVQLLKV